MTFQNIPAELRSYRCKKCGIEKPICDFSKSSSSKLGFAKTCKKCVLKRARELYKQNPQKQLEKSAKFRKEHPDIVKKRNAEFRKNNPEYEKNWSKNNKDKISAKLKNYRLKHLKQVAAKNKEWRTVNKHKVCEYNIKRKTHEAKATPKWANQNKIRKIYISASELGLTVDHIVPLRGKTVCGLHVENNLRIISLSENSAKGNRYWPGM